MSISEVLKQARSEAKLSQEEAAEKIGVSRQTMSNWENGKSYPDFASVVALSDAYDISLDSLLKGDITMIKHLKESTDVTKSNKQAAASIIAFLVFLLGTAAIIAAFGGNLGDFLDVPSWVAMLIPIVAILTVTRSYKVFANGFRIALFPKKEATNEDCKQAASLFRLLSKTAALASVIIFFISLTNMLMKIDYQSELLLDMLGINFATALLVPLYNIFLITFIFEPIVYILKKKNA